MQTDESLPFDEVHAGELAAIKKRREAAKLGLPDLKDPPEADSQDPPLRTVGLALSGGGIRASCFALGFLQALYRRGILRQVDYLSTVSGGGYIGSHLSSQVATTSGKIEWDPEHPAAGSDATPLPFYAPAGAAQPNSVLALARRGESLKQPLRFLSRHLWGLLCVNALALSGLVALGSLAAFLFRMLDLQPVIAILDQLGFGDDFSRALFPTSVMFVVWMVSVAVTAALRKRRLELPPFAMWAYTLLIVVTLMGFTSVLSTGNLDVGLLEKNFGFSKALSDRIRQISMWLGNLLLVLCAASILPNLNLKAVIRSGTKPRNRLEGWVFNLASYSLVLGVPFVVFFVLSQENISGWNDARAQPNSMSPLHIKNWPEFWRRLNRPHRLDDQQKANVLKRDDVTPGDLIALRLNDVELPGKLPAPDTLAERLSKPEATRTSQHPIALCLQLDEWMTAQQKQLWLWERWLRFLESRIGTDDQFEQQLSDSRRLSAWQQAIVTDLNRECLADPSFFKYFKSSTVKNALGAADNLPNVTVPAFSPEKEIPNSLLDNAGIAQRAVMIQQLIPAAQAIRNEIAELYRVDNPQSGPGLDMQLGAAEPAPVRPLNSNTLLATVLGLLPQPQTAGNDKDAIADADLWEWFVRAHQAAIDKHATLVANSKLVAKDDQTRYQKGVTEAANGRQILETLYNRTQSINWNLMRIYFGPQVIYPRSEVFAYVVATHDEQALLHIFWISVSIFLVLGACFSVNPTMLHGFYREALARLWIRPDSKFGTAIPLSELKTCPKGGPLHLLNGTLNLMGQSRRGDRDQLGLFTFSSEFIGSKRTGYSRADRYQRGCDLPDAMAISGAAVTPSATSSVLIRILLVVFNLRLGKWIPNPAHPPGDASWPTPLRLLWERIMFEPENRMFLYVSDGGHCENTGIAALLARRCRVIIAVDASQDEDYQFSEFRKLLAEGEDRYGIRIRLLGESQQAVQLTDLLPAAHSRLAARHYVVLQIEYPEAGSTAAAPDVRTPSAADRQGRTGYLIFVKPTLTGDESQQLLHFRKGATSAAFPNDPTVDQFFEPERFMMYRALGEHIGEELCREQFPDKTGAERDTAWLSENWKPLKIRPAAAMSADAFEDPMQVPVDVNDVTLPAIRKFLASRNQECRALAAMAIHLTVLSDELKKVLIPDLISAAGLPGNSRTTLTTIIEALSDLKSNDPQIARFLLEVAADETIDDVTRAVAGHHQPESSSTSSSGTVEHEEPHVR